MEKGYNLVLEIYFTVKNFITTLTPKVTQKYFGLEFDMFIPKKEQDACIHLEDTSCPLSPKRAENVKYVFRLPILTKYDAVAADFEVKLIGDDNQPQICFVFYGKITGLFKGK